MYKMTTETETSPEVRYHIVPLLSLHIDQVQYYWQLLYAHDLLKDRWLDIKDPTWSDVKEILLRKGRQFWFAVDQETEEIAGEFMFAQAIGRSVQLHYSGNPELSFKNKIRACKEGSRQILENPRISSLTGLTPMKFKHATVLLLKAGWKRGPILKGAVRDHTGQCLDSYIMIYQ